MFLKEIILQWFTKLFRISDMNKFVCVKYKEYLNVIMCSINLRWYSNEIDVVIAIKIQPCFFFGFDFVYEHFSGTKFHFFFVSSSPFNHSAHLFLRVFNLLIIIVCYFFFSMVLSFLQSGWNPFYGVLLHFMWCF